MAQIMGSIVFNFVLLWSSMQYGVLDANSGEAVFINPLVEATAATSVPPSLSTGAFVTQTVYGFLDFTTTIGNTVMVFSPQSAVADGGKDKTTEPVVNAVIDTKPTTNAETQPHLIIKPTETQNKPEKKTSEVFTVVNVQSNTPATLSSKVEIKSQPVSKLTTVESVSSVVNVSPVVSSKIEIVEAAPTTKAPEKNIITKVEVITETSKLETPPIISTRVEVYDGANSKVAVQSQVTSSIVETNSKGDEPAIIGNNIGEPEFEFLSRQPSEVVEETYKVINFKPSSKVTLKPRPTTENKKQQTTLQRPNALHPTGLVTKLGGTIVKDDATTVHETSVIGTYINGKYAQVLQSSSKIIQNSPKVKITPTPTLRILKTAAPSIVKSNKHAPLEPTPASTTLEETSVVPENSVNSLKQLKKPNSPVTSFKPKLKNRPKEQEVEDDNNSKSSSSALYKKNKLKPTPTVKLSTSHYTSTTQHRQFTNKHKFGGKNAGLSVHSDSVATVTATTTTSSRKYNHRKNKSKTSAVTQDTESSTTAFTRKNYKARSIPIQPTNTEQASHQGTSIYKFKLNRLPGRWQYTTTPKPRVNIKKILIGEHHNSSYTTSSTANVLPSLNDIVTPQSKSDDLDGLVASESVASFVGDESSTENKIDNPFPLETIKVEISTPPNFKDTYYEIATIKSPYTFQAGNVKKTRYITVTSTIEKLLEATTTDNLIAPTRSEPLTENILATANNYEKDNNFLDSSIATLPPLYVASDVETPPLETKTETFSTTQTMLKTHILPAVHGGNQTTSYTLVQTYMVTRLVTATKTLPPMEAYHFVPSKILKDFNSHLDEAGSELNLELAFGDDNENEADGLLRKSFPSDLDLANIGSEFNLSDVDKTNLALENHLRAKKAHGFVTPKPTTEAPITPALSTEQLQQLALLRLLNPAAAQGHVITTSKPVIKMETLYTSHIIPLTNGHNTIFTTLSKVLGTITKTDYEYGTSTVLPALPTLPVPPVNPLFQQQFTVVTSPIVQTTVATETSSRILKLTFGAKTAYTTIFSTAVVPTVVTSYTTASVPVPVQAPVAGFPGYFPAPYQPFPYLG